MKRILIISSLLLLLISCNKKEEDIKIGAILPLTGSAAIWGNNVKNGIELAKEKINSTNGVNGKKINIVYEDSEGLPTKAVSSFRSLLNRYNLPAVIGDVASSSFLAMAPIANEEKVVILSPGASNSEITYAGKYVFRNWHSDEQEGIFLAKKAYNTLNMKRMIILYVNNAYGKGLEKIFSSKFEELGGEIIFSEGFRQNETSFRAILSKAKENQNGLDGIFLPGYPEEIPKLLKQAKELNIASQFLCPSAFEDKQTIEIGGQAVEGVIYVYPKQGDTTKTLVKNFYNDYKQKYNKLPGALSDTGYDALMLIKLAIEKYGERPEDIVNGLLDIKSYNGVAGNTSFDDNGDIVKDFELKTVKNGNFRGYNSD